ncbi:hypothetical protein [Nostoc sp. CMAA1605]|uniref:hypothetical protein n=1 Tax=Nostoc sp. CMAA1605 TaxID=2055159 RepID=UPI001F376AF7|nr:hypothetical protein [Nostoc sp. CMAA1605]
MGTGDKVDKVDIEYFSTQHSLLSTQHSLLSTPYSALSTQHSLLSTQHSALPTTSFFTTSSNSCPINI